MNGPSPEEKRRADRIKKRLQEDLFDQVQQQRHGQVLKGMCSFIHSFVVLHLYLLLLWHCYYDAATIPPLTPSPLIPILPLL